MIKAQQVWTFEMAVMLVVYNDFQVRVQVELSTEAPTSGLYSIAVSGSSDIAWRFSISKYSVPKAL